MAQFLIACGAMPTTAALAALATGTAIKTLLQFKPSATLVARIKEWGVSFDGSAAATPIKVGLIETDVAATVTTFVANDIVKYDAAALLGGDPTTNLIQVGTTASGFDATAEGTITASRLLAGPQFIAPTNQWAQQFPLGNEPIVQVGKFARIRVTAPASVNAYAYMIVEV
jgi:hypothetical protein